MRFENEVHDEERAFYGVGGADLIGCSFDGPVDGESALKESENVLADGCYFNLRYPLWHVTGCTVRNSRMTENCRAAMWYGRDISVENCDMRGIKAFRECDYVRITGTSIRSSEFGWKCRDVRVEGSTLMSEYPFFECDRVEADRLEMCGKYSFQYVRDSVIRNSELNTKDAFWHSKNVTVMHSTIRGEYLGWYSEGLHLIDCRIVGTQPLCYCNGLVIEDCTMEGADLCFEKSDVHASIIGRIDSVKNPRSGYIKADGIGEIISECESSDCAIYSGRRVSETDDSGGCRCGETYVDKCIEGC